MKPWINSRKALSTFGVLLGSDYEYVLPVYSSVTLLSVCNKRSEYETHLKTKRVSHSSRAARWLLLKSTEKEWGHYIISQNWLSNLLSLFLRKAFIFLACDPTAMGRQLAETAERNLRNDILKLAHTEALNLLKYDLKAFSHVTQLWSNQLYTNKANP